jgi:hypothetical protein
MILLPSLSLPSVLSVAPGFGFIQPWPVFGLLLVSVRVSPGWPVVISPSRSLPVYIAALVPAWLAQLRLFFSWLLIIPLVPLPSPAQPSPMASRFMPSLVALMALLIIRVVVRVSGFCLPWPAALVGSGSQLNLRFLSERLLMNNIIFLHPGDKAKEKIPSNARVLFLSCLANPPYRDHQMRCKIVDIWPIGPEGKEQDYAVLQVVEGGSTFTVPVCNVRGVAVHVAYEERRSS